jgi:hypothetical protein
MVSPVDLNERLARKRFTVSPLLLEAASIDVRCCAHLVMSAVPPKADIRARGIDVRLGPHLWDSRAGGGAVHSINSGRRAPCSSKWLQKERGRVFHLVG